MFIARDGELFLAPVGATWRSHGALLLFMLDGYKHAAPPEQIPTCLRALFYDVKSLHLRDS